MSIASPGHLWAHSWRSLQPETLALGVRLAFPAAFEVSLAAQKNKEAAARHTEQTMEFRPVLKGELYGPLRSLELFNQVQVDPEVETLVWPNGADFAPEFLYERAQVTA